VQHPVAGVRRLEHEDGSARDGGRGLVLAGARVEEAGREAGAVSEQVQGDGRRFAGGRQHKPCSSPFCHYFSAL